MKTIAQQLGVTEFPFTIKDKNGKQLYYETSDGEWWRHEHDERGNVTSSKNSNGFWCKREYDSGGNEIYYEDSDGEITDNRPKDDVITLNGVKYKRIDQ